MHVSPEIEDLCRDVRCIEDAGGLDAFIELLRADVTEEFERRKRSGRVVPGAERLAIDDALHDAIEKRILLDVSRDLNAAADAEAEGRVRDLWNDRADALFRTVILSMYAEAGD